MRKQLAKVLKTDKMKMTRIWSKMLKTVLADSERMIKKVLSDIITAV